MHAIKLMVLSLAAAAAPGWTFDAGRYPIRQIDRPLILPKRMWQERLVMNHVYFPEDGFFDQDGERLQGFLPNLPTWSITDNLSWEAVPAPLFKYQLTRNQVDGQGRTVIKDFSLAVEAGMTTVVYSSRDGFQTHSVAGLDFKRPWGDRVWLAARLGGGIRNWEPFFASSILGLGLQITDRTYMTTSYIPILALQEGPEAFHTFSEEVGFNFNSGLSLGFHLAWTIGDGFSYLNPGSTLSFQW